MQVYSSLTRDRTFRLNCMYKLTSDTLQLLCRTLIQRSSLAIEPAVQGPAVTSFSCTDAGAVKMWEQLIAVDWG